ncbi:hypothetical protein CRE_23255 [Caenorhabditis remanei]|uniref:CCHC-type domain-containing protein n=1 Tax=Caenorhabditis remanei TaxID=31234 RepID=E3NRT9_CAERE|nr:hypothetical protein CRE_23255 [Caenorhabditis remanei]
MPKASAEPIADSEVSEKSIDQQQEAEFAETQETVDQRREEDFLFPGVDFNCVPIDNNLLGYLRLNEHIGFDLSDTREAEDKRFKEMNEKIKYVMETTTSMTKEVGQLQTKTISFVQKNKQLTAIERQKLKEERERSIGEMKTLRDRVEIIEAASTAPKASGQAVMTEEIHDKILEAVKSTAIETAIRTATGMAQNMEDTRFKQQMMQYNFFAQQQFHQPKRHQQAMMQNQQLMLKNSDKLREIPPITIPNDGVPKESIRIVIPASPPKKSIKERVSYPAAKSMDERISFPSPTSTKEEEDHGRMEHSPTRSISPAKLRDRSPIRSDIDRSARKESPSRRRRPSDRSIDRYAGRRINHRQYDRSDIRRNSYKPDRRRDSYSTRRSPSKRPSDDKHLKRSESRRRSPAKESSKQDKRQQIQPKGKVLWTKTTPHLQYQEAISSRNCVFCDEDHSSEVCAKVTSIGTRLQIYQNKNVCGVCEEDGHLLSQCKNESKMCAKCKSEKLDHRHGPALCTRYLPRLLESLGVTKKPAPTPAKTVSSSSGMTHQSSDEAMEMDSDEERPPTPKRLKTFVDNSENWKRYKEQQGQAAESSQHGQASKDQERLKPRCGDIRSSFRKHDVKSLQAL